MQVPLRLTQAPFGGYMAMESCPYQFRLRFIFYVMTATFCVLSAYFNTEGTDYQEYVVGPVTWAAIAGGFVLAGNRNE